MRERPILFSAPMVRAILEGRKMQTRRVVKGESPGQALDLLNEGFDPRFVAHEENGLCPYGVAGDRLWVREAFSGWHHHENEPPGAWSEGGSIWYWADGNPTEGDWTRPRPSIHMPRWASRITLEITGVRVERLKDISEADALAEGYDPVALLGGTRPVEWFFRLWSEINGRDSLAANPWVWVVEFKRVTA